ncbi:MAG: hypothetical protein IMX01_10630 [Limnochordaceae bacterium]|nr:hypothetical protein [Limnochordaceae bacterium]
MWQWGRAGHALVWLVIALALHRGGPAGLAAGEEVVQLRPPLRDGYVMSWTYGHPEPFLIDDLDGDALPDVVQVGMDHPNGIRVVVDFGDRWGMSLRPDVPKTCGEPPRCATAGHYPGAADRLARRTAARMDGHGFR